MSSSSKFLLGIAVAGLLLIALLLIGSSYLLRNRSAEDPRTAETKDRGRKEEESTKTGKGADRPLPSAKETKKETKRDYAEKIICTWELSTWPKVL
jgi:hypothetical protein